MAKEFANVKPIGVAGHAPPQHSELNKARGGVYEDRGTRHSMPPEAHPGEEGWHDKHEAVRHSRKSMKTNRYM